ncbi:hypothetical protein ACJ41O_010621 [Fusarium nematophilum]
MAPGSSNPAKSVDSKRERSRVAQREYRKRHASKFHGLKEENQRLRDALRKVDRVASKHAHLDQELEDALAEARELVKEDDHDRSLAKISPPSSCPEVASSESASPRVSSSGDQSLFRHMDCEVRRTMTQQRNNSTPFPGQLWLDSDKLVRVYESPADAAPYLGDSLFTLSSCLYWAATRRTVYLWQRHKLKRPRGGGAPDKSLVDRLFNHSRHLYDQEFLMSLASARLEFLQKGYVDLPPSAASQVIWHGIVPELSERIRQEYSERGQTMDWWKTPREVEGMVRRYLEPGEMEELQALVEGRGSAEALGKFAALMESLVRNFVCFGDGPRWNVVYLSLVIGGWKQGQREGHDIDGVGLV